MVGPLSVSSNAFVRLLYLLSLSVLNFEVDRHYKQGTLKTTSHTVDSPSTPPIWSEASCKTGSPNEATRCLDTHHWDAESSHLLQHEGGVDLWEILD